MHNSKLAARHQNFGLASFKSWLLLCIALNAVQYPRAVRATDDVVTPCELEAMLKQLLNPAPENRMHATALRNELENILRQRQLAVGEEQYLNDYDYPEEDKRSVASLAAQGLLHAKRSLATLAKNGQLPTPVPEESETDNDGRQEEKRYVGALARSGGYMGYGKRNVGTLARDFQLPQNGKRNIANMARLGLINGVNREHKRNVAAVARYNSKGKDSNGNEVDKRNLGALKGSPVHGAQHKREEEEYMEAPAYAASASGATGADWDYADNNMNSYWWYPNYVGYADLDWDDYKRRAQKRFLDTSKDPELFGIENAANAGNGVFDGSGGGELLPSTLPGQAPAAPHFLGTQKRHIGAVYRSGFLPSYRALRSSTGSHSGFGGGQFSRSGRARQFAEYFPRLERLPQPTAAVCKLCFLPTTSTIYRPLYNWGFNAPTRSHVPKYISEEEFTESIATNSLPTKKVIYRSGKTLPSQQNNVLAAATHDRRNNWGTPPRITALHRGG